MLAGELEHLGGVDRARPRDRVEGDVWALGDEARVLQIGRALVDERDGPHARRDAGRRTGATAQGSSGARGRGRRPGHPAQQQDAVFERFYRAEGGMASGSGLGPRDRQASSRGSWVAMFGSSRGPGRPSSRSTSPGEPAAAPDGTRFHVKTRSHPERVSAGLVPSVRLRSRACRSCRATSATSTRSGDVRMVDVGAKPCRDGEPWRGRSVRMAPETARRSPTSRRATRS